MNLIKTKRCCTTHTHTHNGKMMRLIESITLPCVPADDPPLPSLTTLTIMCDEKRPFVVNNQL